VGPITNEVGGRPATRGMAFRRMIKGGEGVLQKKKEVRKASSEFCKIPFEGRRYLGRRQERKMPSQLRCSVVPRKPVEKKGPVSLGRSSVQAMALEGAVREGAFRGGEGIPGVPTGGSI